MVVSTQPLMASFGVQYLDVELAADMADDIFLDVERLWYENGIALFRGQAFTEANIIGFCRRLGELEIHVREEYRIPIILSSYRSPTSLRRGARSES